MEFAKAVEHALGKGDNVPAISIKDLAVTLRYANADAFGPRCSSDHDAMSMGVSGYSVAEASQFDAIADRAGPDGIVPPPGVIVVYQFAPAAAAPPAKPVRPSK